MVDSEHVLTLDTGDHWTNASISWLLNHLIPLRLFQTWPGLPGNDVTPTVNLDLVFIARVFIHY